MKHIEINNLTYRYHDGRVALNDVSLKIDKGERVALIGPNGAGKSTLLLQLNGILRGEGEVMIDDKVLCDENLKEIRRTVGLIFQDPNDQLFCPTVRDDVSYGPRYLNYTKSEIEDITRTALMKVGMEHAIDRPSHHLSQGEKRRITIAAVLACDPEILALDEPAATLDPKRKEWLVNFIGESKHTILLATHDMQFARHTCKRAILMNKGKIVADGDIESILSDKQLLAENDL